MYMVNNKTDSARYYFNKVLAADSTVPFSHFNIGTIETLEKNFYKAIDRFISTIDYSTGGREGYVTRLDLYFNKEYTVTDSSLFREFSTKSYIFNMQYLSWLYILYCYLRDEQLLAMKDKQEMVFNWLFKYKEFDVWTWYHHTCWKALLQEKTVALESLEKSLKLGFGNYFQLTSDKDLDYIRDTPEFNALLKKYFPGETSKK